MSKVDSKPVKRPEPKAPSRAAQPKKESQPDVKKSEAPKDRATISKEAGEKGEPAKNGEHVNALKDSLSPRKLSEEKQGANCIDKASELARKDDQALFLKDSQNKDGNDAGHVVLQRDGRIVDPNRPDQPYENYESYKQANPQYNEVLGQTSGENLQRITAAKTPEERQAAIQSAGLEGIANEKFADGALPPERGTENEARAQTPGNAGMYGQVTVETQRPVQTSNGTSVSMSVKREDGVTVGGGAKGLAAEHDSATQRGFEVTMPEAQFAEYERTGQLPDAANPQSWHNGTSMTWTTSEFNRTKAELGDTATLGFQVEQGRGGLVGVQKRDDGSVRYVQGDQRAVEYAMSAGVGAKGIGLTAELANETSQQKVKFEDHTLDHEGNTLRQFGTMESIKDRSTLNVQSQLGPFQKSWNLMDKNSEVSLTTYGQGPRNGEQELTITRNTGGGLVMEHTASTAKPDSPETRLTMSNLSEKQVADMRQRMTDLTGGNDWGSVNGDGNLVLNNTGLEALAEAGRNARQDGSFLPATIRDQDLASGGDFVNSLLRQGNSQHAWTEMYSILTA